MKTDPELQTDVVAALKREPGVPASEIEVAVRRGAVRSRGVAHTYLDKYAAERAALGVSGVRAVSQEIRVNGEGTDGGRDGEIAEAVSRALQAQAGVPAAVQASVEGGWVTLRGDVVSEAQRQAAVEAVRRRAGVERIYNLLTIQPTARPVGVKAEADEARHSNGAIRAERVAV